MITDIKSHSSYRDSGVPWMPQVPEHWEVRRIKTLFREKEERSGDGNGLLLSLTRARGIIPQAEASNRIASAEDLSKYKLCKPGDLVMNRMQAWSGMFGLSSREGLVSPDYSVFGAITDSEVKYFELLFRTPCVVDQFAQRSKGIGSGFNRLYTPDFGAIPVMVPPRLEQAAIVRFLDDVDRRIRRYILAKQKLIKLLAEQKQFIIQYAVTRGLDSNVRLKDSGVDSIGEIPAHWHVAQLRRLAKRGTIITYGIVQAGPDVDGGIPYIRTSDMRGTSFPREGYLRTSPEIDRSYSRSKVEHNDLVVAIRASLGKGMLVPAFLVGANLTQGTARFSPGDRINPNYLSAAFNAKAAQDQVWSSAKGVTFFEITLEALRKIILPIPPLNEQETIAGFVSESTQTFESAMSHAIREIELLREYRTRLIADVVTGKLDVRQAAEQLPGETEEPVDLPLADDALKDGEEAELASEEFAEEKVVG